MCNLLNANQISADYNFFGMRKTMAPIAKSPMING